MRLRVVEVDMLRRGVGVGLVAVALLVAGVTGGVAAGSVAEAGVVAPDGAGGGGGSEGGIEGLVGGFLDGKGLVGAILVLGAGGLLLTACVEKLISYLTRAAFGLRVSLFALAILFTGFEFDDTVVALVLSGGGLEGAALGTALGTALAIVGVTLALAAVVRPFSVDLPTDYVALFALGPLVLVPFVLAGTLTFVHGLLLVGAFVLAFGYVLVREYRRETPVFRNTELGESVRSDGGERDSRRGTERADGGHALPNSVASIPEDRVVAGRTGSGWLWISLAVAALAGIVFASMLLEAGSEAVVEGTGIDGTVFGATVLTAILTFEDVMLTLEPVRRGVPEIGVGNVVGSVLFSVTGNVGVVMLLSDLTISRSVLTFHLPAVVVVTALAAYFFHEGRLKRWHGALLGGLYVAYWVIALAAFGGVPLGG
ncbi:sodium:proton exchanger [Halorussus gelatinilyticus]|uniref:Sodium:proton exchanger n=1 Tax=Halorussus gelatinilyticus TaxID=2937524 RepID=A0A8U0IPN8_9EURY|nr:sodium:proton exchanger [Halorussus gelatinilyticus]UPW01979.1 sodium:proton exchanger [Halorussus gelatinilyticus]